MLSWSPPTPESRACFVLHFLHQQASTLLVYTGFIESFLCAENTSAVAGNGFNESGKNEVAATCVAQQRVAQLSGFFCESESFHMWSFYSPRV